MQARPHPGSDIVNEIQFTEPEEPTNEIIMPKEEEQSFGNKVLNAISVEAHSCVITPSNVR